MSFLKALSPKFFILLGTADSAMISASGFLVNLMAGRFLSIEAYGQFLILLTLASFALIFQSALVSTPYSILSQSEERDLSGCFRGSLGMTLLLGLLSALGGVIAYLFYGVSTPFLLGAFALYIFLNLVQDFFRRHYYATRQEVQAFLLDFISYGGQVIVLFSQRFTLQLESLFFYLSMTSLLAVLISASLNFARKNSHPKTQIHLLSEFKTTACQSWQLGRWLLFSNGVSWLVSQFYVVVLGYNTTGFSHRSTGSGSLHCRLV